MRKLLFVFLILAMTGCSSLPQEDSVFIPPSDFEPTAAPVENSPQADAPVAENPAVTETPLPTATPLLVTEPAAPSPTPVPATPTANPVNDGPILYYTQAGDTLQAVAVRFHVSPEEITSPQPIPTRGFIDPNQLLLIPRRLSNTTSSTHLLPDSEFVFSLSSIGYDTYGFVGEADGYLRNYGEYLGSSGETTGAEIVQRVAYDNSINPRLLLALLEYQSGWVYGEPETELAKDYPLGYLNGLSKGLLGQLKWAVNQLSIGYYNWREGRLNQLEFSDGVTAYMAPDLNAGTAALQYYFSQVYDSQGWLQALDPETGFPALYEEMFGNPWRRAEDVEPLFPPDLTQPEMELPFLIGTMWSYTGGPHGAWEKDGSWAGIDFAPSSTISGCVESDAWVVASAAGVVARSERGIVVIDLDGDGFEQTGWAIVYLHIATEDRVDFGEWVEPGEYLGHPSCEGGRATGTHVHMARKYNGEWMAADGPIPFVLSGWHVRSAGEPYQGYLVRGDETIKASQVGNYNSRIERQREQ